MCICSVLTICALRYKSQFLASVNLSPIVFMLLLYQTICDNYSYYFQAITFIIFSIGHTGYLCVDNCIVVWHFAYCNTHYRPEGKKYEKALEWGIQVVNSTFLAEIIHNGREPAVLFPRHTKLGQADEFTSSCCFEATRLLSEYVHVFTDYWVSIQSTHAQITEWVYKACMHRLLNGCTLYVYECVHVQCVITE